VRKVLSSLDSNSRQSVIAFHGEFRDERRHVRSLYKHSDLYSWGLPLFAIVQTFADRTICRPCYAQIEHTCRSVPVFSFLAKRTAVRDGITEIARYYMPSDRGCNYQTIRGRAMDTDNSKITPSGAASGKLKRYPHGRASYTVSTFCT